jgi:hypothetical protein
MFSIQDRTFQHHFNLVSPGYGTIRCHLITLPPNHDMPGGNKPFQLRVNGVSYFEFSSIFQLGTPAMIVRPQPAGASSSSARSNGEADPYMSPDERQAIARAKLESLRDIRKANSKDSADGYNNAAPRSAPQEQSLISFDDPPAPPQGVSVGPHMMSSMSMNSASFADSGGSFHTIPPPAPAAQYSNYALPQNAAPQYAQQPAAQQYQQPAAPPQYGQQPATPAYQQPAAAPPQYAGAITPYGQAPAAAAPYSNYGFAQAPAAAAPQQSYGFAPPPAAAWASPPPAYHGGQQPLAVNTAVAPGTPGGAYGTTPQSQVSYGSAPAFAQPPRQQSGQFGGY